MSASTEKGRVLRRIGAVLAGLAAVVFLSTATDAILHAVGVYPPLGQTISNSLFALATAYRLAFAVAGGYITARLAPFRPVQHSVILGIIGTVISIAGVIVSWNAPEIGPRWYPIALAVTALPASWVGGRFVEQTRKTASVESV